jgi:2-amino-4-hydroxy-6-hydroxymethyldihydropteridine diphosphokinase
LGAFPNIDSDEEHGAALIYLALGSNLPNCRGHPPLWSCRAAVTRLAELPGLRLLAASRWYRSAPIPAGNQPDYINGVVALSGTAEPAWLMAELHRIEADWGRVRGETNAARVLDLDIVDMDGTVRAAPGPVLPHPRAHQRAFVLLPLREVAPAWVHPRLGTPIGALIDALPPQDITPLED